MGDNGNERFTVLMGLARKFAGRYPGHDLRLIRVPDYMWFVTLTAWVDGVLPPRDGYKESLEEVLEAFVIKPRT